uniref:Uncharacterized protein n=1 Tax=Micrurus lemniscatus lemniscatus TaxID=129467 RepID=A0A2D4JNX9_MICLE
MGSSRLDLFYFKTIKKRSCFEEHLYHSFAVDRSLSNCFLFSTTLRGHPRQTMDLPAFQKKHGVIPKGPMDISAEVLNTTWNRQVEMTLNWIAPCRLIPLHLPTAYGIIKSNPNPVGNGQVVGSSVWNILTICEMNVTQICL